MPMTADQIVQETGQWPPEQVMELVDRLTLKLHQTINPEAESVWKQEARRRLAEIETGKVQAVPGEDVSNKVRQIVGR
jgi:putative addiction module component (TIGR02574 family)